MVNLSTSQFPYAYALDGSELIGVVQNGNNVKATIGTVNGLIADKSYVRLGHYSYTESGYSIAIGSEAHAVAYSVAIGRGAYAVSTRTVAIGRYAFTPAADGIAIGNGAWSDGYRGISIGREAEARQNRSMAIGSGSYTIGGEACMSLGNYAFTQGNNNIALGTNARVQSGNSQIAIGYEAYSDCFASIAIGSNAKVISNYSGGYHNIAIGTNSRASYYFNIAIGYQANYDSYSYVGKTTVVGHKSIATDWYGTVIGYDSRAGFYGVAVGAYAHAFDHSVALGSSIAGDYSVAIGTCAAFAGYAILIGNYCVTGYNYCTVIGNNTASMAIGDFTMRGIGQTSISMAPTDRQQRFIGQTTTGNQTVALTADGNSPSSSPNNLAAIPSGTMARMTATVIGHGGNVANFDPTATADYDSVSFVLSPTLVIRYYDATYAFVGNAPSFTLENSTAGAAGWDVPVLNIVNTNELHITVTNSSTVVDWIAFVKFEAGS